MSFPEVILTSFNQAAKTFQPLKTNETLTNQQELIIPEAVHLPMEEGIQPCVVCQQTTHAWLMDFCRCSMFTIVVVINKNFKKIK